MLLLKEYSFLYLLQDFACTTSTYILPRCLLLILNCFAARTADAVRNPETRKMTAQESSGGKGPPLDTLSYPTFRFPTFAYTTEPSLAVRPLKIINPDLPHPGKGGNSLLPTAQQTSSSAKKLNFSQAIRQPSDSILSRHLASSHFHHISHLTSHLQLIPRLGCQCMSDTVAESLPRLARLPRLSHGKRILPFKGLEFRHHHVSSNRNHRDQP